MNEHLVNYIFQIEQVLIKFINNPIAIKTAIIALFILIASFSFVRITKLREKKLSILWVDIDRIYASLITIILFKIYKYAGPLLTSVAPKTIDYACDIFTIIISVNVILQLIDHSLTNKEYKDSINKISRTLLWIISIIVISDSHNNVIDMLDEMSIHIGKFSISIWDLLRDACIVVVAIILSSIINRYTTKKIAHAQTIDGNFKQILLRISKIIIFVVTTITVLPLIGINMTAFSVIGGAVGVGIGFGLQKIASNFLSGFIILMDRSIKVGDRLVVDNNAGIITKITMRYVVMNRFDGTDVLIPNETFITNNIQNQSYSNKLLRSEILCNISNKQNLDDALSNIKNILETTPNTIPEKCGVIINKFIDNGVEIRCLFWAINPDYANSTSNHIYIELIKLFTNGIILAPQTSQKIEIISPVK